MNNLVQFITVTKGVEYLIAIWFIIAFVALWYWVRNRGQVKIMRMLLLMGMVGAVGAGVAACVGTLP